MKDNSRLQRVWNSARALKQAYDQVQGEATVDTLKRCQVLLLVALPLHTALSLWFSLYVAPAGRPDLQAWADALAWLQGGLVVVLLVLGLLARTLLRRGAGAGLAGMAVQAVFCAAYLAFGAAAGILDVGVGNGIATFLVICMAVAVLSLMRPALSAALFGLAFVFFFSVLRTRAIDSALLASLQIQAIAVVLMAQLIAVMVWHQYACRVLLSRRLEAAHADLLAKQKELESLAEHDMLTGLYNRRKFMQLAEQELGRVSRIPTETWLLMVDLDFFKRINDQYGHPVGDGVLQQVAAILKDGVRSTDVVARIGGEEFIVLMPNTRREGAMAVAEKLRIAVRTRPLELLERLVPVTASFGVTGLAPHQRASIDTLYAAADKALYVAKNLGRDRVECLDPAVTDVSSSLVHDRS